MNNPLRNQISPEDQPMADHLTSTAQGMHISPNFQSNLETQLMNAHPSQHQRPSSWFSKAFTTLGWALAGFAGILFLSWAIRSLIPGPTPSQEILPTPEISLEANVRSGHICTASLALAHGFKVYLSSTNKTEFIRLDPQKTIGELRALAWSPDGQHLALVGNTTGHGNIFVTGATGDALQPVLPKSELGYLMEVVWSHDGKQFLTWSVANNSVIYLIEADGTGIEKITLNLYMASTPQFTPDGTRIILVGANSTVAGLLEVNLADRQTRVISRLVEDATGFAWSSDGSHLAYMEMDRELGEARLISEEFVTGNKITLTTFPIPKGSGSSLPTASNLSWAPDGSQVVFDFGRGANDRAIYLAYTDGTGIVKLAEAARTPALSADGCLAYISRGQVFLMDLRGLTSPSIPPSFGLADLPASSANADFRLDKLQWGAVSQ